MDGIFGIYAPGGKEMVHKTFLGTGSIQHRGKACAGIAVVNDEGIHIHKDLGRIGDVIDPDSIEILQSLHPIAAIGNVGYTKNKYPAKQNTEPIHIHSKNNSKLEIALTMDGYLVKEEDLKSELEPDYYFETANKTEVVGALLHKFIEEEGITFNAGRKLVDILKGRATFALTALVYDGKDSYMLTLNDSKAFEPFCYGMIDDAFVISSESCSHRRLAGFIEREYDGAEMTICSSDGAETRRLLEEIIMPDIFQGVYFGNITSLFRGKEMHKIRRELGHGLVDYYGVPDADIIIPNPDSGWGVTMGIFERVFEKLGERAFDYLKEPIVVKDLEAFTQLQELMTVYLALVRQPQAVRTFQEGEQKARLLQVGLKFLTIDSLVKGKRVVMGDDSIVKASISAGGAVWSVYNAGAKWLEFWLSYGAMFFPSFKELHRGEECLHELGVQRAFKNGNPYDKSLDEINTAVAKLIKVEAVKYNTKEAIEAVTGPGSFQALDASYPIDEEFRPDWLKIEEEKFHKYR